MAVRQQDTHNRSNRSDRGKETGEQWLKVMLLLKRKPGLNHHVPLVLRGANKLKRYQRHYLHPGRR